MAQKVAQHFMHRVSVSCDTAPSGAQSLEEVLRTCQTSRLEQELISKYILIEDYFMRESLTKAGQL